jgi:hypothetical protein
VGFFDEGANVVGKALGLADGLDVGLFEGDNVVGEALGLSDGLEVIGD